ncbi:hypothetical protein DBV05_g9980 [Lasiodiplodia theobromae]|uniref:Uncharacterized protein n=1 Tax=Lasiodiplodia theobromae TaxID=45133 RepID=A0A5N5D160_9PEZI|nr:hypothetical protein DBV05_g9980 [Lasiodiplodia theobromae]
MPSSPSFPSSFAAAAAAADRHLAMVDWAAATRDFAIADWADSIPAIRPPPDPWARDKLSSALHYLRVAQRHINAASRSNIRDDHQRACTYDSAAARLCLEKMARCIGAAQKRLDAVGQHNDYIERNLRHVLRDAEASVESTFGDLRVAEENCEYDEYRLERVLWRMGREYI